MRAVLRRTSVLVATVLAAGSIAAVQAGSASAVPVSPYLYCNSSSPILQSTVQAKPAAQQTVPLTCTFGGYYRYVVGAAVLTNFSWSEEKAVTVGRPTTVISRGGAGSFTINVPVSMGDQGLVSSGNYSPFYQVTLANIAKRGESATDYLYCGYYGFGGFYCGDDD